MTIPLLNNVLLFTTEQGLGEKVMYVYCNKILSLFSINPINMISLCKSLHNTNTATKEATHKVFSLSAECSYERSRFPNCKRLMVMEKGPSSATVIRWLFESWFS